MRKIFIISAVLLAVSLHCYAENVSQSDNVDDKPISKNAEKIDEFGKVYEEDLRSRFDNFLVTLQNNPTFKGVIIAYQGTDVLPANFDLPLERLYQNHIRFRSFDPNRVEVINGGFRKVQATELWIVPPGAEMPKPSNTVPKPKLPKNKTFLYDRVVIESHYFEGFYSGTDYLSDYLLPIVKAEPEAEKRASEEKWKSEYFHSRQAIEDEAEVEQPKTPEEIESEKFYWLSKNFGEVIKNQKSSTGLIIFYADDQIYDVARLQTFIDEGRRKIAKEANIEPAKIQIFFGGYRGSAEAEFWIMPRNGAFPTPTPEERPVEELDEDNY
jgi:hypothetical protein